MSEEVDGSIATGDWRETAPTTPAPTEIRPGWRRRASAAVDRAGLFPVAVVLVGIAAVVYSLSSPWRVEIYTHFVWQADAWLNGRAEIPFPVSAGPYTNDFFQDVMPAAGRPGYGLLPYPPLPSLVLLPFVAVFGMETPAATICALLAALNVGLAWWLATRVTADRLAALLAAVFFGFGTVAWYAAMVGSTWFFAHHVALAATLLAAIVAIGPRKRRATTGAPGRVSAGGVVETDGTGTPRDRTREPGVGALTAAWRHLRPDARIVAAAFLLGLASLARLTVVFGVPFLFFAGRGSPVRRAASIALGLAVPLGALLAYNLIATGEPFNPAYAYAARYELHPVPEFYHPDWGLEDLRYLPQNLLVALAWPPQVHLECGLGLLDPACGTLRPDPLSMSLVLTSPACLLAVPLVRRWFGRDRLVTGSALAVAAIALIDLAHFSQGWVQFGYRFSNDWAPFAIVLVALAVAQRGVDRRAVWLVGVSVLVNAWGVYWGAVQGW